MRGIECCVRWNSLDFVVSIIDYDLDDYDGAHITTADVSIDYEVIPGKPFPADVPMTMVKAMVEEENERFFNKINEDLRCQEVMVDAVLEYEREFEDWGAYDPRY